MKRRYRSAGTLAEKRHRMLVGGLVGLPFALLLVLIGMTGASWLAGPVVITGIAAAIYAEVRVGRRPNQQRQVASPEPDLPPGVRRVDRSRD